MKIWLLNNNIDGYEYFGYKNEKDAKVFTFGFRGNRMADQWEKVELVTYENGKESDFPGFPTPIFSSTAKQVLDEIISGAVEFLPIYHKNGTYYALNVINIVNGLDYNKSLLIRDKELDIVNDVKRYSFIEDVVRVESIFKLPEFRATRIFVTDLFKKRVEETGLVGFEFHEVWDSEKDYSLEEAEKALPTIHPIEDEYYSFDIAWKMAEQGEVAAASGEWKIKRSKNGQYMVIGKWTGTRYDYFLPHYVPPILLEMKWKIVKIEY
ncbi:imm11 family protein [Caldalkalibacillus salinus]|uniref:imm11 family protein n=1 Tax=Caldalkalibacillus salinus TaxID=2803787 RepID=UPI001923CF85|nr:DUF1629 domain-containing protein [Caldalkalibacillus salinus]